MVGYLIGGKDRLKVPLYNDNPAFVNGLYFGADTPTQTYAYAQQRGANREGLHGAGLAL
jgi:hypothetical protein